MPWRSGRSSWADLLGGARYRGGPAAASPAADSRCGGEEVGDREVTRDAPDPVALADPEGGVLEGGATDLPTGLRLLPAAEEGGPALEGDGVGPVERGDLRLDAEDRV